MRAQKGILKLRLIASGRAAHSGYPRRASRRSRSSSRRSPSCGPCRSAQVRSSALGSSTSAR
jgi:hypothetical protein